MLFDETVPVKLVNHPLVSKCNIHELKVLRDVCSINDMFYDIFRINRNGYFEDFDSNSKNFEYLVIPLMKFHHPYLRTSIPLSTFDFNNINGGITDFLFESFYYPNNTYELIELVEFEGKYFNHTPSGYFNYDKYLNINNIRYNDRTITLFREMEKWLKKDIPSNLINIYFQDPNNEVEKSWKKFHENRENELIEGLDWFYEMEGLSREVDRLDELNQSGLTDFDDDNLYWNID